MQCASSYLGINESFLGTLQNEEFFGSRVESAPLTLVRRENIFSDLRIAPWLVNSGRVSLLNNLTFPSCALDRQ